MAGKYDDLSREELIRLLEARERRTRFGLVWEANEIERDEALRRKPRAPYAWDGVAEVRPFGAMTKTIVEGVY